LHEGKLFKGDLGTTLFMKLPKDVLALLEEFWAEEYESDYRRFVEIEKPAKFRRKHLW
jgi:hypothetical protein